MIKKFALFVFGLMVLLFASCRKDTPEGVGANNLTISANGVYITNEGNFQFGNAEVSYYNPDQGTVTEDLFKPANKRKLGDVCQSMCFLNEKAYIVVNNSGKVEVVNKNTFASVGTITGFTSPRYFLPVSNAKAYVTDYAANKIAIVNLASNTITGSINCNGFTEELALAYGKAFVTNRRTNKVYVINTSTDVISDSITVGYSSSSIKEDKNGKIWVLCSGDTAKSILASLYRINPIDNSIEQSFQFPSLSDGPSNLDINGSNDTLYYINKGIYQMPITANNLTTTPLIAKRSSSIFYGIGIDPSNGTIYVADAIDYVQRGVVYRYKPNGTLINKFLAGIIPGDFYFR